MGVEAVGALGWEKRLYCRCSRMRVEAAGALGW